MENIEQGAEQGLERDMTGQQGGNMGGQQQGNSGGGFSGMEDQAADGMVNQGESFPTTVVLIVRSSSSSTLSPIPGTINSA